jgi:hypothetical protein
LSNAETLQASNCVTTTIKIIPRATSAGVATEILKELYMKIAKVSMALFGAALLFSAGAVAGESNKGTLQLADKVIVEGKTLDSGKYTVEWAGSGPTVQVTVLRGKDTVTTFSAHVTEQPIANPRGSYSTVSEPDGSKALTAIYPGGKRVTLQLEQNEARQQASAPASK